jgi:hypothetical protein
MFEIVNRLHAELKSIVEIPDVQQRVFMTQRLRSAKQLN